MSLDVVCIVFLLFFLFGIAVSASEEEYGYPRKLPEPNNMLTQYSRGYVGHLREEEE